MKSFIIQIEERDETVLMEVLRRFAVSVQPTKSTKSKKEEIAPKTVAHFLEISKTLSNWSEEDILKISVVHEQLNQIQPATW